MRDEYDIQKIYKVMYEMAKKVAPKVYTSDRPKATTDKPDGFIVVSLPNGYRDKLALGTGTAKFQLFIRDTKTGLENLDLLTEWQKGILEQLPCTVDGYQFFNPIIIPMGGDQKGFHVYSITTNLIII